MKHSVNGTPDPNFKEDKDYVQVYDEKKKVYRKVHVDDLPPEAKVVESFNVNITHH